MAAASLVMDSPCDHEFSQNLVFQINGVGTTEKRNPQRGQCLSVGVSLSNAGAKDVAQAKAFAAKCSTVLGGSGH